ncbi:MAG: ATP-binding protein [Lachnospiraceae bacterium]|nr:ATP-binding protein [Lachnospiraceae bacterium]
MIAIERMLVYKSLKEDTILQKMVWVAGSLDDGMVSEADKKECFYDVVSGLISLAHDHGYEGNLWHDYLAYLIADNENAYSLACEKRGATKGSINEVVLGDFAIFKKLFDINLSKIDKVLGTTCGSYTLEYKDDERGPKTFNIKIRDRICELANALAAAGTPEEIRDKVAGFYKDFGVGKFGLHKAFRIDHDEDGKVIIEPINNTAHVSLDDLIGYDIPKQKLIDNTEDFVMGRAANNCLLFGDAGTGKSTSIKAVLNRYYPQGLRMIEVYKHQFKDLNAVLSVIKNRNYKFIIYMDDLSFEEFEIEYKYLKAIIEGGLEVKPGNVLIYATSNRRHLIREKFSDKSERDDELHSNDTVQEKLSLVNRFGVTIYFGSPSPQEFQTIVTGLANKNGIKMPPEELLSEARKWEMAHGGLSGRCAQQFIDYIAAKEQKEHEL